MLTRVLTYLTAGTFLVAGLLYGLSFKLKSRSQAEILATPEAVDLGPVEQGQKIPFTFRVKNTVAAPITVVGLIPSCGCTWLDDVNGSDIGPGGVLPIRGKLDTGDRRGRTESHAVLTYRASPSGTDRNLILAVRATVRATVRVVPETITFDLDPAIGDEMAKSVSIDSDRIGSFSVIDAVPSVSWITAEVDEREFRKDGNSPQAAKLRVTIDPTGLDADGGFSTSANHSLRIRTTAASGKALVIPIRIRKTLKRNVP